MARTAKATKATKATKKVAKSKATKATKKAVKSPAEAASRQIEDFRPTLINFLRESLRLEAAYQAKQPISRSEFVRLRIGDIVMTRWEDHPDSYVPMLIISKHQSLSRDYRAIYLDRLKGRVDNLVWLLREDVTSVIGNMVDLRYSTASDALDTFIRMQDTDERDKTKAAVQRVLTELEEGRIAASLMKQLIYEVVVKFSLIIPPPNAAGKRLPKTELEKWGRRAVDRVLDEHNKLDGPNIRKLIGRRLRATLSAAS